MAVGGPSTRQNTFLSHSQLSTAESSATTYPTKISQSLSLSAEIAVTISLDKIAFIFQSEDFPSLIVV